MRQKPPGMDVQPRRCERHRAAGSTAAVRDARCRPRRARRASWKGARFPGRHNRNRVGRWRGSARRAPRRERAAEHRAARQDARQRGAERRRDHHAVEILDDVVALHRLAAPQVATLGRSSSSPSTRRARPGRKPSMWRAPRRRPSRAHWRWRHCAGARPRRVRTPRRRRPNERVGQSPNRAMQHVGALQPGYGAYRPPSRTVRSPPSTSTKPR